MSPDLPGLPTLGSAGIGIGQSWRQPGSRVLLEAALHRAQANQRALLPGHDGLAPRAVPPDGRSTMGVVSVPSRSIASVTVSPGCR